MSSTASKPGALDAVLGRLFRLRPDEAPRALSMAAYLMCVVATYAIGRNVGDTLFLSRADLSLLPYMYVAGAATLVPVSWAYARWIDRGRRDRVIQRVLITFGAVLALFYAVLRAGLAGEWIYPALYLGVGVVGSITMMQVWTLAQDLYDAREAKRLFPLIGAGGVVANVACGFGIQILAPIVGPEALLLVGATLLGVAASLVSSAVHGREGDLSKPRAAPRPPARTPKGDGALEPARESRYLHLLGAMIVVMFVVVSLVDYQLKVFAKSAYQHAELSAFFGRFYGTAGLVSGVVQLFVTSKLLERHGIAVSLVLLPLGIALGAGAMLVPSIALLSAAVVAKGAESVLRYTVNDAATQLLYVPVPAAVRARAKATFDGVLKPVATAGAGLLLAALATIRPSQELARDLAWVDLALVIVWIAIVLLLQREYVAALMKTLRQRRLDFSTAYRPLDDAATLGLLRRSLSSENDAEVLAAIALVPVVDATLDEELGALLDRRSSAVRLAALECLEHRPSARTAHVRALLDDEDDAVRAAAARVLATRGGGIEDALFTRLTHTSAKVRAHAIIEAFTRGPEAAREARTALDGLVRAEAPGDRVEAARALGAIPSTDVDALARLTHDEVPAVRAAAVQAAATRRTAELVPLFVRALGRADTEQAASRALVELGPAIEPALLEIIDDPHVALGVRVRVPAVLAVAGQQAALDGLVARLDAEVMELAIACAKAAGKIRRRSPTLRIDDARITQVVERELSTAYQLLAILEDLALPSGALLGDALWGRYRASLQLVFRVLGLRYAPKTLQLVWLNLDADDRAVRANALELLDTFVAKADTRLLLPLLEDRPASQKLALGESTFGLERKSADAWVHTLLDHPHPWVVTCALHAASLTRSVPPSLISPKLEDGDAVVRETAEWTLARLTDRA